MWGRVTHSDSLMCWDTTTTPVVAEGPMQDFLATVSALVSLFAWHTGRVELILHLHLAHM